MTGLGKRQKLVLRWLAQSGTWSSHCLGGWNYNESAHETQQVLESLQVRGLVQCKGHALGTYFLTPDGWDVVVELHGTPPNYIYLKPTGIACLAIILMMGGLPSDEKEKLKALHVKGKRLHSRYGSPFMKPPKKAVYRSLLPQFGLAKKSRTFTDTEIVDAMDAGLALMDEPWRFSQLAAFVRDMDHILRKRKKNQ